ncbi:peptide transporter family 1-like [Epargyreus clarus]|uniref:peptide transporter family 1-like n=1 Tax=Epargyreus clarus TaxID=520877 RepID=UPI003C2FF494
MMCKDLEKDVMHRDIKPVKDRFPRVVMIIMLTEFCERFSYSGMRAFLTLYLRSKLGYSDEGATETYHIFNTFVYVFPIFGGIIADNWLGKYRTILYMMFVYAAGNILVAITAIPQLHLPGRLCTFIGLLMITMGTGGIKPCVTTFGGDQFKLPQQDKYLPVYFSMLYFNLCVGSLIAKTVSPILRSDVHCFGDKDCYSLAFGAPGLVIIAAIVIFFAARRTYIIKKPEGNIIVEFVKCVAMGLKNVITKKRVEKQVHWLDSTQGYFGKTFVRDTKKTLSILTLFAILPMVWALLDQLGSRWTLQATKMDGRFGFVTVKPDQLQALSPICILILIPIFQKFVYPYLEKRNILVNPLHKITLGGALTGVAFIVSAVVEIYLKTTYPILPQQGLSQIRVFNGNPCSISIHNEELNLMYTIPSLSHFVKRDIRMRGTENVTFSLGGHCIEPRDEVLLLEEKSAVSFFVSGNDVIRLRDNIDKSKSGLPVVRFLVQNVTSNITLHNERRNEVEFHVHGISPQVEVFASTYSIRVNGEDILKDIELESGGVYTILIDNSQNIHRAQVIVITAANSITMALLLPQFIIMSIGEVLFAVTGNEFAFKESPQSMKAVMTAVFLLTESGGNIIIIVITRWFGNYAQETQSFIYTGLAFVSVAVFHYLARGYQLGHAEDDDTPRKECSNEMTYLQVKQEDWEEH